MNELQEELKFFIKEIELYDDWQNFFSDLKIIKNREILKTFDFLDSPNCDIKETLNKLKSLLSQHEPFKTNSEEETNCTEDVSKSFEEEQQELESSYGGCSICETWEEGSRIRMKYGNGLPSIVISHENFCPKHEVDPIQVAVDRLFENVIFYEKKCTRETVTGIYTLSDILEIPEKNSLPFEEAVASLRSSLDNIDSYDVMKILVDIIEGIEKIVSLSPGHKTDKQPFTRTTLGIGLGLTKRALRNKAEDILDLVDEIDSEVSDLSVSAEVEMVQILIPALSTIRYYINYIHRSHPWRSYSSVIQYLEPLETIFKAYCKHQTSITSMKQEDISLEYEKIAECIALLKSIDKKMCDRSYSDSD